MIDAIQQTESLAKANALEFKDHGNGHVQISGHGVLVNYYPLSKRRTAYNVSTGETIKDCGPWDAVKLCLTSAKNGMKPKKPSKREPDVKLEPVTTNPAGLKHFYKGDVPPWEHPTFISAHSDLMRMEAYQLREAADLNDAIAGT